MKPIHSFLIFSVLLITEIIIAVYVTFPFIRHFVGDILVIPLLVFFLKIFIKTPDNKLIISTVFFAFMIEIAQLFHFVDVFHIQNNILRTMIGTTFAYTDLLAYVLGGAITYYFVNTRK